MSDTQLPLSVVTLIQLALMEDVGPGDVTSRYFVPEDATSSARIFAKEDGVTAGIEVAAEVFRQVDGLLSVRVAKDDSEPFGKGDTLLQIAGPTRSILTAERTALNFLQRLCGVATQTRRYVETVKPHATKILDTRKTTPGWRWLEKHAVACGGGTNHRMGLYDMAMVKDNHLLADDAQADLQAAIDAVKKDHPNMRVELEADTLDQVKRFLELRGLDVILLDNMSTATMREAVEMVKGKVELEASGGVTLERIAEIAATGVDYISSGALTHSVRSVDLSLELSGA
ncbi:nicotinate-nucleotide pyrophosphorylase [carboxylating] [Roseimicrobium gellanilyticum]|uniref:Probable nicotinate-nucleotide pyrophosphorylase [carboxylating] n=1 Tax=Roseimicrobium gellanilyticum TaxID=748857 RepID=A0A366H300_9BACT|nr:carboxylating nicotinate-nucleotide diphosphorylase [Roseimicrobium gellanilyticum]RBP36319.1 nicotinate-nucleotide pyrophosphorylase [carboxylating] [Roseimicrobium gellanilyticum]